MSDIENYMKRADVAVSAGGSTLYELCAVGTPTISYALADNLNSLEKVLYHILVMSEMVSKLLLV